MYVAYTHCKDELVKAMKAAAMASNNPAMKGWAFDLEARRAPYCHRKFSFPVG